MRRALFASSFSRFRAAAGKAALAAALGSALPASALNRLHESSCSPGPRAKMQSPFTLAAGLHHAVEEEAEGGGLPLRGRWQLPLSLTLRGSRRIEVGAAFKIALGERVNASDTVTREEPGAGEAPGFTHLGVGLKFQVDARHAFQFDLLANLAKSSRQGAAFGWLLFTAPLPSLSVLFWNRLGLLPELTGSEDGLAAETAVYPRLRLFSAGAVSAGTPASLHLELPLIASARYPDAENSLALDIEPALLLSFPQDRSLRLGLVRGLFGAAREPALRLKLDLQTGF